MRYINRCFTYLLTHVSGATREAGLAARVATAHKEAKYADINGRYIFARNVFMTLRISTFQLSSYKMILTVGLLKTLASSQR